MTRRYRPGPRVRRFRAAPFYQAVCRTCYGLCNGAGGRGQCFLCEARERGERLRAIENGDAS